MHCVSHLLVTFALPSGCSKETMDVLCMIELSMSKSQWVLIGLTDLAVPYGTYPFLFIFLLCLVVRLVRQGDDHVGPALPRDNAPGCRHNRLPLRVQILSPFG